MDKGQFIPELKIKIPIFPLELVLFPGLPLPLYIFEERYKEMTRFCWDNRQVFGVTLFQKGQPRTIGCTSRIHNILSEKPDGRRNILCMGENRFEILEYFPSKDSYDEALVRILADWDEDSRDLELEKDRGLELLEQFTQLSQRPLDRSLFEQYGARTFSYLMAEICSLPLGEQQEFLEMRSGIGRFQRVSSHMAALNRKLVLNHQLQEFLGSQEDFTQILN